MKTDQTALKFDARVNELHRARMEEKDEGKAKALATSLYDVRLV